MVEEGSATPSRGKAPTSYSNSAKVPKMKAEPPPPPSLLRYGPWSTL